MEATTLILNFVIAALSLVLLFKIILRKLNGPKLPPGPLGLPFVGYLPFLEDRVEITFSKLEKKYGGVFSLYLGNKLTVILANYQSIETAFMKNDDFNDRPDNVSFKIEPDDKGIITTSGEDWRIHRRHIVRTFRDIGIDKTSFEVQIQEGIHQLLHFLEKSNGEPMNPKLPLRLCLTNTMLHILCGKKIDYEDPFLETISMCTDDFEKLIAHATVRSLMPWTRFLPFINDFTTHNHIKMVKDTVSGYFEGCVKEKEESNDYSQIDYISCFLRESKEEQKKAGTDFFKKKYLYDNLFELLESGINTLDPSLRWTLLLLMIHPEVQKKLQHEIDEIIGMDRHPTMADRIRMPYAEAVIMEVQRYCTLVPTNVSHSNLKTTTLLGYDIPPNTSVISNLWAVHNDPTLWENPEKFSPQRFIRNGQFEKPPYLIPFSAGKRKCLGENLAKIQLFLYVTSIFQKYTIEFPENEQVSDEPIAHGLVNVPKPYRLLAKARKC